MRCMILVSIMLLGLAPSSPLANGEEGRQRRQPPSAEHMSGCKVSIVTGASSNHFRSLLNLLDSLHEEIGPSLHHDRGRDSSNEETGHGMDISVIVYDIGLLDREKQDLDQHLKGLGIRAESRKFDFMAWPPHVQDLDCRAWKPIIFHEALGDAETAIWMDAGCLVSDGGVLLDALEQTCLGGRGRKRCLSGMSCVGSSRVERGALLVSSNGLSGPLTHPWTRLLLNCSDEEAGTLSGRKQIAGTAVAMSRSSEAFQQLAVPWMMCAHDPSCICPSRKVRKDQAALTVLAHKAGYSWEGTDSEDIGILFHQDIDADVEFVDCRATVIKEDGLEDQENHGRDGRLDAVDVVFSLRVVCHDAHDDQDCCIRGMSHVGAFGIPPYYVLLGDPHFDGKPEFLCNSKGTIEIKQTYPKMAIEEGIESGGDVKTSGKEGTAVPSDSVNHLGTLVGTSSGRNLLPAPVCRFTLLDGRGKDVVDIQITGSFS